MNVDTLILVLPGESGGHMLSLCCQVMDVDTLILCAARLFLSCQITVDTISYHLLLPGDGGGHGYL